MKLDDLILVSVDDHIVEPPTVFANHIPKKWAERAPRFVYRDEWLRRDGRWWLARREIEIQHRRAAD